MLVTTRDFLAQIVHSKPDNRIALDILEQALALADFEVLGDGTIDSNIAEEELARACLRYTIAKNGNTQVMYDLLRSDSPEEIVKDFMNKPLPIEGELYYLAVDFGEVWGDWITKPESRVFTDLFDAFGYLDNSRMDIILPVPVG